MTTLNSVKIYLILIITLYTACELTGQKSIQTESGPLNVVDSVSFLLPFSQSPNHSAKYYDKKSKQQLLYFADLTTRKKVIFFNKKGQEKYSVDLTDGLKSLDNNVHDIEVISLDTILLIQPYTNRVVLLNQEGHVWKNIDLNQTLKLTLDSVQQYEFISSLSNTSAIINNQDLVFFVNIILNDKGYDSPFDWVFANRVNYWKNNQFIRINNVLSDSPSHLFGGKLRQAISPKDSNAYIVEIFNHFLVTTKYIYATNLFSNKVFIIDAETLEVIGVKVIKSKYTSLGIPVLSSKTTEENEMVSKKVSQFFKQKGKLGTINYNETKEHFYIQAGIDHDSKQAGNWILMIFDKDFNKLNEYLINPKDYLAPLVVTDEGFMLIKATELEDYNNQKMVMHEFAY